MLRFCVSLWLAIATCTATAICQTQNTPSPDKVTAPGVSIELATIDGRTTYHMGEEIKIVTRYRSTIPGRYLLETAICSKYVATADTFQRQPGMTQLVGVSMGCYSPHFEKRRTLTPDPGPRLAVETRRVVLGADPVELWSPGNMHYSQLGEHIVSITSRRVYPLDAPPVTATAVPDSPYEMTSNTLHIMIVPADLAWQSGIFSEIVPSLRDPRRKDENSCDRLNELTSREATSERIHQVRFHGPCRERVWFHTSLDFQALHTLFPEPKFPVTTGVLDQLAEASVHVEDPALDDWDNSNLTFEEYGQRYSAAFEKGRRRYTNELLALTPKKIGVARTVSLQTARYLDNALKRSGL
ncbi:MAG: hypothetical protein WB919_03805 [Candidatus Sulfotelmatobacter sp.]